MRYIWVQLFTTVLMFKVACRLCVIMNSIISKLSTYLTTTNRQVEEENTYT